MFLLITPIMSGVIARTYGLYALLGRVGMINQILLGLGVIKEPLELLFSENAILVGLLEINLPFMVIPIMTSILRIGPQVEEAAKTLGANRLQVFLRITLPLSLPGIVSGSLLCFTLGLGAFATPVFLGGATNQVLTMLVYDEVMTLLNWPFASAVLLVLVTIVVIPSALYLKISRR
jgi:putative spermidine/putrescine transport system permease protein